MAQLVVGAALFDASGRLLAAQRGHPPALAGLWEFPGGKVEPGEDERAALVRECREELAVAIAIDPGPRAFVGEVPIGIGMLRVYRARIVSGVPQLGEHTVLRWLRPDELLDVPWIPADLPLVRRLMKV